MAASTNAKLSDPTPPVSALELTPPPVAGGPKPVRLPVARRSVRCLSSPPSYVTPLRRSSRRSLALAPCPW
eukprot:scaffold73321_cov36-Tisochrysis_lutea.AAC.2